MKKLAILLCLLVLIGGCSKGEPAPVVKEGPPPEEPQDPPQVEQPAQVITPQLPGAVIAMIDNYYKARPQSGLDKADIVYEIIAEGGITRYMALFYSKEVEKIGPIRSARYYFVQLARGYNSPYAHAGGSVDGLEMIQKLKVKDLDEINNSGAYFWRDKSRKAPHNLYSSTAKLIEGAKKKGYALVPLPEMPLGSSWSGEAHQDLRLDYSTKNSTYIVSWRYNGQEYERFIDGKAHVLEDGTPVKAQNVLVFAVPTRDVVKQVLVSEVDIIGKGQLLYFIDGKKMTGSWEKASATGPINFKDAQGQPLKIKSGNVWIQVLPSLDKLSY